MFTSIKISLAAAVLLGASASVWAEVKIDNAWVRTTVAQQKATGAFMQITSSDNRRLTGVSTPLAGIAEVHQMSMEGNIMKMRPLDNGLELPAGKTVELKPGSYHIMLMDLKGQIKPGDDVLLKLSFETADKKTVTQEVHATAASAVPASDAHQKH